VRYLDTNLTSKFDNNLDG